MIWFGRLRAALRNYVAGGDASQWHYDDIQAQIRMRRYADGRWEYRVPTADEVADYVARRAGW